MGKNEQGASGAKKIKTLEKHNLIRWIKRALEKILPEKDNSLWSPQPLCHENTARAPPSPEHGPSQAHAAWPAALTDCVARDGRQSAWRRSTPRGRRVPSSSLVAAPPPPPGLPETTESPCSESPAGDFMHQRQDPREERERNQTGLSSRPTYDFVFLRLQLPGTAPVAPARGTRWVYHTAVCVTQHSVPGQHSSPASRLRPLAGHATASSPCAVAFVNL